MYKSTYPFRPRIWRSLDPLNSQTMSKVIDSFLRKESCTGKNGLWTNGVKLFQGDTCVAQWEEHRVLVSYTIYSIKELDDVITNLLKVVDRSWLPYTKCSKAVPPGTGDLTKFL